MTVVLQLPPGTKINSFDWPDEAEELIAIISTKANFVGVFGKPMEEKNAPQGYTTAYTFGEHCFYFSTAYNENQPQMGVIIKFSAQALDYYCETTGQQVYEFLQRVDDPAYTLRLSRVDITADYIDEGLCVTDIYQSLIDRKVGIFQEHISPKTGEVFYRHYEIQISGFVRGSEVPTIYLGSVQSKAQLRIYDKKREQLERKGSKLDKARRCKDWVRFEGIFKSTFAHQLTDELMNIQNNDEFINLLACTLVQKFRFMYMTCGVAEYETEYTQMLLDCISNNGFVLRSPSSRNYDLANSICYMLGGSGVISTLYKVAQIWGNDGLSGLSNLINKCLADYEPNDDCRYWLKRNAKDYKMYYPDFDLFLKTNILPLCGRLEN